MKDSPLDSFFKWKVGESVCLRQGIGHPFSTKPYPMVIVQRVLVECYGGIQAAYEFTLLTDKGANRVQFIEVELMDAPPPEAPK